MSNISTDFATTSTFYELQGNLFLQSQLQQVFAGKNIHQTEAEYLIPPGQTLKDEFSRAFNIATKSYVDFKHCLEQNNVHNDTREQLRLTKIFVHNILTHCLGYSLTPKSSETIHHLESDPNSHARIFPLSFVSHNMPILVVPALLNLDTLSPLLEVKGSGYRKKTAFQVMQEMLNATTRYTWGLVSNGYHLRLLHTDHSLTRVCYLDFNLEQILEHESYADFYHLYLTLHSSRLTVPINQSTTPAPQKGDSKTEHKEQGQQNLCDFNQSTTINDTNVLDDAREQTDSAINENTITLCIWDMWQKEGENLGQPAREKLSKSIVEALELLGNGFISNSENTELLEQFLYGGGVPHLIFINNYYA